MTMPLTRDFRETVRARAERDPQFREALLREAVQALLDGDAAGGRAAMREASMRRSASKGWARCWTGRRKA
jgi:ribosomal protein L4